jgi:hypothetical protein
MLTPINTKPDDPTLVYSLETFGLNMLRLSSSAEQRTTLEPAVLIAALAEHTEPRLREALIPLFLRKPQLHQYVPELVTSLPSDTTDVLRHFYTAAVYLQRLWFSTLQLYLGAFPLLPDYYGESYYQLPPPDIHFGEAGLRTLAKRYTHLTGTDWLTTYEAAISLLLTQLNLEQLPHG